MSMCSNAGYQTVGTVRNNRRGIRAKDREEIERPWYVPGKSIIPKSRRQIVACASDFWETETTTTGHILPSKVPVGRQQLRRRLRPATINPRPRPSPSPMDPTAKRQHRPRRRCRLMAQQRLSKSAASAAIVEAVRVHPNGNGSSPADRNEFVREVPTLTHVRAFFSFHLWLFVHFP